MSSTKPDLSAVVHDNLAPLSLSHITCELFAIDLNRHMNLIFYYRRSVTGARITNSICFGNRATCIPRLVLPSHSVKCLGRNNGAERINTVFRLDCIFCFIICEPYELPRYRNA